MAQDGWIKCYRSIMDSAVWDDEWLVKLWLWCLLRANHQRRNFKGVDIERGQFVTGRMSAADELGVSPSKWYRGMERLVSLGCITTTANSSWTTVTVCNYGVYQDTSDDERTANEQRMNSQRTANEQPADTIEECKNVRIEEERESEEPDVEWGGPVLDKKPQKRFVPPTVEQVQAYIDQLNLNLDAGVFVDHYTGNGWKVGPNKMKDWQATARNWSRKNGPKKSRILTEEELANWSPYGD